MMERRNQARGANEWEDTYGSIGTAAPMQLTQLPLGILDPWEDGSGGPQPFKPYSQDKLQELAENIRKNGVIEAICVRPTADGRFQIIAGHNRVAAAKLAGLTTIPAVAQQMDDNEAALRMVDSNLQHRETLLPSEKAFAYRIQLEAMNRQGQRTDLTYSPLDNKLKGGTAAQEVGRKSGDSQPQIFRYIRLTYLIPALLELVDSKKFGFRAAVEVSYISQEEQELLLRVIEENSLKMPNLSTANALRRYSKETPLSEEIICALMLPPDKEQADRSQISTERIQIFFPPNATAKEMEETILEALTAYFNKKEV